MATTANEVFINDDLMEYDGHFAGCGVWYKFLDHDEEVTISVEAYGGKVFDLDCVRGGKTVFMMEEESNTTADELIRSAIEIYWDDYCL